MTATIRRWANAQETDLFAENSLIAIVRAGRADTSAEAVIVRLSLKAQPSDKEDKKRGCPPARRGRNRAVQRRVI